MLAIKPQYRSGCWVISWGPGCIPLIINAASITDITAFSGNPNASSGMNPVLAAASSAADGPARPSMEPDPISSLYLLSFFSAAYAPNCAITVPPPGIIPKKLPTALPRRALGIMRLKLAHDGISLTFPLKGVRVLSLSRFRTISANPKQPNATLTIPIPSYRNVSPNVNRIVPVLISVPIQPIRIPIITIPSPFILLPETTMLIDMNPKIISLQYSAGPNRNDT